LCYVFLLKTYIIYWLGNSGQNFRQPQHAECWRFKFLAAARNGCKGQKQSQTIGNNQLPIQSITRKPKAENIYAFWCGKMNDLTLTKRCQCHEKKSQKVSRAERQKLEAKRNALGTRTGCFWWILVQNAWILPTI